MLITWSFTLDRGILGDPRSSSISHSLHNRAIDLKWCPTPLPICTFLWLLRALERTESLIFFISGVCRLWGQETHFLVLFEYLACYPTDSWLLRNMSTNEGEAVICPDLWTRALKAVMPGYRRAQMTCLKVPVYFTYTVPRSHHFFESGWGREVRWGGGGGGFSHTFPSPELENASSQGLWDFPEEKEPGVHRAEAQTLLYLQSGREFSLYKSNVSKR